MKSFTLWAYRKTSPVILIIQVICLLPLKTELTRLHNIYGDIRNASFIECLPYILWLLAALLTPITIYLIDERYNKKVARHNRWVKKQLKKEIAEPDALDELISSAISFEDMGK